jgi:hypothetical protein
MKNVVILGVVAVVLVVFGYFALFSTPASEMADEAKNVSEELSVDAPSGAASAEPRQGRGTLDYLRSFGANLECTVSYSDEAQQSSVSGTYFVSEGSMRGDFLTTAPPTPGQILSSMIIDNGMMYMWSEIEGGLYGVKTDLSVVASSDMVDREPVPLNTDVDYDCKPWKEVDRTVFVPPSEVLFQDMTKLMQGGMEYGTVYEGEEMPVLEVQ